MDKVEGAGGAGTPEAPTPKAEEKPAGGEKPAGEKPAGDAKPAGAGTEKPAGTEQPGSKAGAQPEPPKAPETYALKVPEASKQFFDDADLKAIETDARAKGLTNDQAQAVVEDVAKRLSATSAAFRTETEADPTFGGEHLADTQKAARVALDKFAPAGDPLGDGVRRILEKTGYGNNLPIVAMLARIGKAMAEDRPGHTGNRGGGTQARDAASVLYGDPAKS